MTRAMRALVKKEIRALWPAWAIAMMLMLIFAPDRQWQGLAIGAYMLGAAALGALSVGHEYSHRTIGLMLSQPVRRQHMLLAKLGVLAPMLLILAAVAGEVLFNRTGSLFGSDSFGPDRLVGLAAVLLPMVAALFLSPWLTMICRSPIAGTVFTISLPGMLTGLLFVALTFVFGELRARAVEPAALIGCLLGLLAIAAAMSWRTFMRFEAIDGGGQDLRLPSWLGRLTSAATATHVLTKRNPIWLLVKKEVHLQQMMLAFTALYILGWLMVTTLNNVATGLLTPVSVLTLFYFLMVPLLIGSTASAEERHLGTLEWQVLQPMRTSTQWIVKVSVALGLAVVLGLVLPSVFLWLNPTVQQVLKVPPPITEPEAVVGVITLTVGSLYVSSLCRGALWGLLMSIPAILGATVVGNQLLKAGMHSFYPRTRPVLQLQAPFVGASPHFMSILALFVISGFILLVLRFGLQNHRSADRSVWRVVAQVATMAAMVLVAMSLMGSLMAVL